jgi:hypothetical protein
MIDWVGVGTNSLWLLGLAVGLAVFSYADWSAHDTHQRLRDVFGQAALRVPLWSGLILFCVGVALSGGRWWERALWGILAVMAAAEVWRAGRTLKCTPDNKSSKEQ